MLKWEDSMKVLYIYLIVINVIAFGVMGVDKYKAQRHKWRISESSIFIIGLAGGGVGVLIGMGVFHHKTKHLKFTIGIPVVVVLNIASLIYILKSIK
jgi:uncharacterized membrane protein YsdA (DUF1294 family)